MPSSYTQTGIELIATGEQSGTWGTTTNVNLQIIDRLTNGVGAIALSGTTHTLTTTDGALSDGQYAVLVFGGSPSGTNTVTISPNDADHVYIVKNNSGQSVVLTQGSGGNVTVTNGKSAIVYADGAGAGAAVVDVTSTFNFQPLTATLTAIGALATTDGNFIVGNGSTWVAEDGATARTSLGLGSIATQAANNVSITGGSITGITDLAVSDGGTGASSFTANNVLLGNGTSAFQVVAPGTSGNVLQSNGTTWTSGVAPSTALTSNTRQAVTSSATTTIDISSGQVIDLTMAASITSLSFTNVPASGTPILIQIIVRNDAGGAAYTITWPSSVYWSGLYALTSGINIQDSPELALGSNGITVISLLTTDGGTKYRGWVEASIRGGVSKGIFAWGYNQSGQLGQNERFNNRSSPVQIGSFVNWDSVTKGFNQTVTAIKQDGTLWAWGAGSQGQIGDGETIARSSPVQVGFDTNWLKSSSAALATLAIRTTGTLWSWGSLTNGISGRNNNSGQVNSPVQVGSLTTWADISADKAQHCLAVTTSGTLFSWGLNDNGQLGSNTITNLSSPVQVGALTNWSKGFAGAVTSFAVKTDGTLWAWGRGDYGMLGLNSVTSRSSPVQVGALTNWSKVSTQSSASVAGFTLAVKTDGTLWSWGRNLYGVLGHNDDVNRSSPVQIGAGTNWSGVATGASFCIASKTDGTLWSWGRNQYGQLGLNDVASRSSPVQVGSKSIWGDAIGAGSTTSIAITSATSNPA